MVEYPPSIELGSKHLLTILAERKLSPFRGIIADWLVSSTEFLGVIILWEHLISAPIAIFFHSITISLTISITLLVTFPSQEPAVTCFIFLPTVSNVAHRMQSTKSTAEGEST